MPMVSVTGSARNTVFARIGSRLRVAGMAEIARHDSRIPESRIETLVAAAPDNMLSNTGHGALGFTLAFGSAAELAAALGRAATPPR
jgi:D-amino-acid dehydrogenase